ncbi:hypothetical protein B0S90_1883 [Caldicellulosiruptor bescii]|uniref:Uncharacterized protein n=2 Tax=Caldicellulosiruptor bescii TaxID=31899 RepID=B9MK19_CALBD|nr:hypothetical protein [Caldicellulosiruptor bescii]ACM60677.1 hypothetical protein Athe_1581 [Caldicellulosiruptor bescii DSM 6725]PBC88084.1 hypothetical protein B0S87_1022 [Caldicellulosiruptor bescii]PBC91016.1 hypothetical protein B0S89_1384 [Caldicellulosiruptor bescii]PBD06815.1 hypothetical protein B0S90_1883 [Caldicellulosiruptor bescii]PBD08181.1 hypothetical protein B0S84_0504 [Caldicellulosiruptor bescii]
MLAKKNTKVGCSSINIKIFKFDIGYTRTETEKRGNKTITTTIKI